MPTSARCSSTHENSDADVTLHLVRVGDPRAFGCVPTDSDGVVTAFLEKTQDPPTDQINAGCYVFKREVIDRIPKGRAVSVEREVFPPLLSDGLKVCGYVDATYWRDMGTPDDFVRGSADLVRGIAPSPALDGHRGEELVHDGAAVAPGALLIGGTVVGRGAEIGPGARLDGAVIFDGARIEAGAVIERSIIGFGARIGPRALIRDGVIGDGADIGARCELLRGARVWPGVHDPRRRHPLLDRRLSGCALVRLSAGTRAEITMCGGGQLPEAEVGVVRQAVERPPPQIQGFVAAGDLGARRGVRDELQVEVAGRHAQRARDRVHVQRRRHRVDRRPVDAGFLGGLAQRRGGDVGVAVLAVPAELHPPAEPGVQGQAASGCRCGRGPAPRR